MEKFIRDEQGNYIIAGPVSGDDLVRQAAAILEAKMYGDIMTKPEDVKQFLKFKLAGLEHEIFSIMFLDTRHRVIDFQILFTGTIDAATVYPREVVKAALKVNAAALIIAHNHPSGIPEPSHADRMLTKRLCDACALVEIRIIDHIVVGGSETVSFAERGYL